MKLVDGFWLPDSDTHFEYYASGPDGLAGYQGAQRTKAYDYCKNFRVAIDVGAHVGIFSRAFAERFEKVHAFEPWGGNWHCLGMNVPDNVHIHRMALGADCDYKRISLNEPHNTGAAFVGKKGTHVEIYPLDIKQWDDIDLIKIDVQGMEHEVLKGAAGTIERCKPVLLIEEAPFKGSTVHIEEVTKMLLKWGYTRQEKIGADRIWSWEEHKFGATWTV